MGLHGFYVGRWEWRSEGRGRNSRVSTTSPGLLRSDVGALTGEGASVGSSQRGASETTHLSEGAWRGEGRGRGVRRVSDPPPTAARLGPDGPGAGTALP